MAHSASLAAKAPEDAPIATAADASGPEDGMQADAVDDDDLVAPAPTFLTCRLHGGLLQQPVISKCGVRSGRFPHGRACGWLLNTATYPGALCLARAGAALVLPGVRRASAGRRAAVPAGRHAAAQCWRAVAQPGGAYQPGRVCLGHVGAERAADALRDALGRGDYRPQSMSASSPCGAATGYRGWRAWWTRPSWATPAAARPRCR